MQPRLARTKITLLTFTFVLPLLLAVTAYLFRDELSITSQSAGTLLTPPLSVTQLQLSTLAGEPLTAADFAAYWWLIYLAPPSCSDECGTQNAKLRSIYLALTKNMPRVKRLMLLPAGALSPEQLDKAKLDRPLVINQINNPDYLLANCPVARAEGLYLMDPLGNLMLCYAPQQEAHAILQDVEKLLKTSRIG